MQDILEILKYILPAIVVLLASTLIVRRFMQTDLKRKQLDILRDNQHSTVPLRLQAYERLVLFVERIHPRNLIPRVYQSGMTVAELQGAVLFTINSEFEHNLSQQIYVTSGVWETVRGVKEQQLNMINSIAQQLNPDAPARDLHQRIVDYLLTVEEMPIDGALQMINNEAKAVLSYGAGV